MPGESEYETESEAWSGHQFPAERCRWKMYGVAHLPFTKISKKSCRFLHEISKRAFS